MGLEPAIAQLVQGRFWGFKAGLGCVSEAPKDARGGKREK